MRSIPAVVQFGNPRRPSECQPVIVLPIQYSRKAVPIVEKGIRVQVFVSKEFVCAAMKSVRARFGCKTLYSTCGAAHFRRHRGSSDFELGKSIDRGRRFIE